MPRNQPDRPLPGELQSLLVHWVQVANGQHMPRKEDFRMRSLVAWRAHVAIVSPSAQGMTRRYLFHQVGPTLDARLGRAMMMKGLADIPPPLRAGMRTLLTGARMNCAPAIARAQVPQPNGTDVTWCDLVLPLYEGTMPGGKLIFASYPLEGEKDTDSRGTVEARSSCEAPEDRASI